MKWFWKNLDPDTTIFRMDQIPPSDGFRWCDLDQALVALKLSKLSEEMQKAFFKDEAEISSKAERGVTAPISFRPSSTNR
jgi:hypothetical protein